MPGPRRARPAPSPWERLAYDRTCRRAYLRRASQIGRVQGAEPAQSVSPGCVDRPTFDSCSEPPTPRGAPMTTTQQPGKQDLSWLDEVTMTELERNPYPTYERLRREAPLAFVPVLGSYVASTAEICR